LLSARNNAFHVSRHFLNGVFAGQLSVKSKI
jgi:hypothetical protein